MAWRNPSHFYYFQVWNYTILNRIIFMRRKKAGKLKEIQFWNDFFYFNVPKHLNAVPAHLERANFRRYHVDDEGISMMMTAVSSIFQLDLDETEITNASISKLTELDHLGELRLKNCKGIDPQCASDLYKIKGLELLHLGGTAINAEALLNAGTFKTLKELFISSDAEEDSFLKKLALMLPEGCELIVNHQKF